MNLLLALALLGGCKDKDAAKDGDGPVHTGETDLDTGPPPACTAEVVSITPETGNVEVYYRDSLEVAFSEDGSLAEFRLEHRESGLVQSQTVAWGEGNLKAEISPDLPMQPNAVYDLTVTVCESEWASDFTTTEYGAELSVAPEDMVGTTSVLLFTQVNFVEPEGIGMLLSLYLDVPLLVGVDAASSSSIDLLVGQGYFDSVEGFKQRMNLATWAFRDADFTEAPWFQVSKPEVVIRYSGLDIPVTDFTLEGTFSADGSHYGGGVLSGLGDTRYMGGLFMGGTDDPDYVCGTLAAPMGIECEICPDGEPYCLFLRGEEITTQSQPGLTVTEVPED